jgi:hypothetical protein
MNIAKKYFIYLLFLYALFCGYFNPSQTIDSNIKLPAPIPLTNNNKNI